MSDVHERERPLLAQPRCPYCHEDVSRGESLQVCAVCHAFHHGACWSELGGCAACGAGRTPRAEAPVRGVATRANVRERAVRRSVWRSTVGRVAVLAGALVLAGVGTAWLVNRNNAIDPGSSVPLLQSRPSVAGKAHTPLEVARDFVQHNVGLARDRDSAHLAAVRAAQVADLVTPATLDLLELTNFEAKLEPSPPGEHSVGDPDSETGRTFVDLAGMRYPLVRTGNEWRVDLFLAPEWTYVGGGRLRLPVGLPTHERSSRWSQGGVTLTWWQDQLPIPGDVREDTIGGQRIWFHQSDSERGSERMAYGDYKGSDGLQLSASGPPGSGPALERLLRASLETYEPPGLQRETSYVGAALEARTLPEGFTVCAPREGSGSDSFVVTCQPAEVAELSRPEHDAQPVITFEVPTAFLPHRALTRRNSATGGSLLVLHATGTVDGHAFHLRASSFTGAGDAAVAMRLGAMADSFARIPDAVLWPQPEEKAIRVPGGFGVFRPPRGWRLTDNGEDVQVWQGYDGDSIEVHALSVSQFASWPDVLVQREVAAGFRLGMVVRASSPERKAKVAEVARRCFETFGPR